ncbi:amidase family protein [Amycolatopsis sp. GM8]|uniref:amidase family protein n=1 Tax=Amycolatopsis sp. GM8 TaxID=2896530 RepID=UPI001EEDAAE9|nr:amidase family protein [Amycolatopsis sp. GM8]
MFVVPDTGQIIEVARKLGIHVTAEEAVIYREFLEVQLAARDDFVQSRIEEERPPLLYPAREPGYRPNRAEDPLNAWTWKCRIEGAGEGILAGRTISYKDQVAIAGMPMSIGSFALDGFIPDFDATIVTRVLAAGGTVTGHNIQNGLGGGFGIGGGIGDYGRPLNPHNPDHVTGASSAGSAIAVAVSDVDISFGGDQGGSIRIPAAMTGTIGLKPTFGLVSHFGVGFGTDQSIDHTGPMARTSADVAAALQATAGYDGYDPRQGRDVPESMDVLTGLDHGVQGLRIGVLEEGFHDVSPEVNDLVVAAIEVLAEQGAVVSKISVPAHATAGIAQAALMPEGSRALFETGFYGAFTKTYYPATLLAAVHRLWTEQPDLLAPRTKLGYIEAEFTRRTYHGRVYAKAQNSRPYYVKQFAKAFAEVDVLVMPTCPETAPVYEAPGSYLEALRHDLITSARTAARNTFTYNYTGHPALAVPVGKLSGLPVSMQLVGRFFDDPLLLRVAYAYEHSVDWDAIIAVGS